MDSWHPLDDAMWSYHARAVGDSAVKVHRSLRHHGPCRGPLHPGPRAPGSGEGLSSWREVALVPSGLVTVSARRR